MVATFPYTGKAEGRLVASGEWLVVSEQFTVDSSQLTVHSLRSRLSLIINSTFQLADSNYIKLIQGGA